MIRCIPLLVLSGISCRPDASTAGRQTDTGGPPGGAGTVVAIEASPAPGTRYGAPLVAAAVAFRFGEGPAIGATLASAPLGSPDIRGTARAALPLPASPPEAPSDLGGGLEGVVYGLVVFEDADGDGAWTEGETLAGLATSRWLAWLEPARDSGLADPAGPGWNILDLGLQGTYGDGRCLLDTDAVLAWRDGWPQAADPQEPVRVTLSGLAASLSLSGVVLLDGIPDDHVAAVPYQRLTGGSDDLAPFFDVPIRDGIFSALLDEAPPAPADVGNDPDWRYALGYPLGYQDVDGDGWTADDPRSGAVPCRDGQVVTVRYTRPVHSWKGWRLLDCYAATVGWRAVVVDPDTGQPRFLDAAAAAALAIDGSCSAAR